MSEVESYCASAALVAVTMHEPADVGVSVVLVIEQSPDTFVNVTEPEPEPPVVVRVRLALKVAVVLVNEKVDCVARSMTKLCVSAVAAEYSVLPD